MGLAVGITGGIGSGKSAVTGILAAHGWEIIDVDRLALTVYEHPEVRSRVIESFGADCFVGQKPDRHVLAKAVFQDPLKLRRLNEIVWPPMIELLQIRIRDLKAGSKLPVAAEMAVLFEAKCQRLFDRILVVTAPEEIRIRRVGAARHLTEEDIRKRIASQLNDEIKCDQADYVIDNSGTPGQLEEQTRAFIKWIMSQ